MDPDVEWECGNGQADTQTHTAVWPNMHFASPTPHAKKVTKQRPSTEHSLTFRVRTCN